jgi:hypothetical protein
MGRREYKINQGQYLDYLWSLCIVLLELREGTHISITLIRVHMIANKAVKFLKKWNLHLTIHFAYCTCHPSIVYKFCIVVGHSISTNVSN